MHFRLSRFEILTGAATALLCLSFVCLFSEMASIQESIAVRANAALKGPGVYWSSAAADGGAITVQGAVQNKTVERVMVERVSAVSGVTAVHSDVLIIGDEGWCQGLINRLLEEQQIEFEQGKSSLQADSLAHVEVLAMITRRCDTAIEIAAHTDATGDAEANRRLSQRRAEVVAKHLAQLGVPARQLRSRGYGESQPVAVNNTQQGRRHNQRIELRVLGETA